MERKEIEFWIVINADGDVTGDADEQTALDRMVEDWGGNRFRTVKLRLDVPMPEPVEVSITLPEEQAEAPTVTVTEGA